MAEWTRCNKAFESSLLFGQPLPGPTPFCCCSSNYLPSFVSHAFTSKLQVALSCLLKTDFILQSAFQSFYRPSEVYSVLLISPSFIQPPLVLHKHPALQPTGLLTVAAAHWFCTAPYLCSSCFFCLEDSPRPL